MIQCVMLLGGKGTRLGLPDRPKPMVDINGVPLLRLSLQGLAAQGVRRFLFLVDHMSDVIKEAFGDGSLDGLNITYATDRSGLGTAGATRAAANLLEDEFLVVYGDLLFDVDINRFYAAARMVDGCGTLMLHPNDHPFDSEIVSLAERTGPTAPIAAIYRKPAPYGVLQRNLVNAGLYYLRKAALDDIDQNAERPDWARDVFPAAVAHGSRYHGYRTIEYIKDVGTPDRVARGKRDAAQDKVQRRSYRTPQPAVFLDRDGVVNREIGGVIGPDRLELLPGAGEAIARLNAAGVPAIIVTNQPGVAKGQMSRADLERVHIQLDYQLAQYGAYVDDLYCCIHHPDKGFPGEVLELKVACDCRKPSDGMLRRAAQDHFLCLESSMLIGDRDVDIEAGRRAGCLTVHVPTNASDTWATPAPAADRRASTLESAIDIALAHFSHSPM